MKNVVNIINFIRAVEPRVERDLYRPVEEQIDLLRKNDLRGTFLLQYDALLDERFVNLMHSCSGFCEVGLWFEVVQQLVEEIGEQWHGRYSWDWHTDKGFLIGYKPEVRLRLIDECMEKFKAVFGSYPKAVGSWHIDAVSMKHLADKYGVDACCICRDEIGTDGYTLQGGYYNQAYYPSVNNMFCPAQSDDTQINMPVFRMLGSDPIYSNDYQAIDYGIKIRPLTLEPAVLGGIPSWCDWFFDEVFDGSGISFQYTQAGQENSFGWDAMRVGLEYQFPLIRKLVDEGKLEVMTLGESGRWYKDTYKHTPSATISAFTDWKHDRYKSLWYSSIRYRTSLMWDDGIVRIRDLYLFDDKYQEHYIDKRCETNSCEYRNLPVMDGAIYTNEKDGIIAGLYFTDGKDNIKWDNISYAEKDSTATVVLSNENGHAVITFDETSLSVTSNIETLALSAVYDKDKFYGHDITYFGNNNTKFTNITFVSEAVAKDNTASFVFDGFSYSLKVTEGALTEKFNILSRNGSIKIEM